jgi:hypothetical protein
MLLSTWLVAEKHQRVVRAAHQSCLFRLQGQEIPLRHRLDDHRIQRRRRQEIDDAHLALSLLEFVNADAVFVLADRRPACAARGRHLAQALEGEGNEERDQQQRAADRQNPLAVPPKEFEHV